MADKKLRQRITISLDEDKSKSEGSDEEQLFETAGSIFACNAGNERGNGPGMEGLL